MSTASTAKKDQKNSHLSDEKRAYWEKKLLDFVVRGREERAKKTAAMLWPMDVPGTKAARVGWFLVHYPARGLQELAGALGQSVHGDNMGALVAQASSAALSLDEAQLASIAALPGFGGEWHRQARVLREAARDIAAGEDQRALRRLDAISIGSPFEDGARYLRGLQAHYQGNDQQSRAILARIQPESSLWRPARRLLGRSLASDGASNSDEHLAILWRSIDKLERDNPRRAVEIFSAAADKFAPHIREGLGRLFARFLVAKGWRPDKTSQFISRHLSADVESSDHDSSKHSPSNYSEEQTRARILTTLCAAQKECVRTLLLQWLALYENFDDLAHLLPPDQHPFARGELQRELAIVAAHIAIEQERRAIAADEVGHLSPAQLRDMTVKLWRQVCDAFPDQSEDRAGLVDALFQAGREDEFIALLGASLKRFPRDPHLLVMATRVARKDGEEEKAWQYISRAMAIMPEHPWIQDQFFELTRQRAARFYRAGDAAGARACYRKFDAYQDAFDASLIKNNLIKNGLIKKSLINKSVIKNLEIALDTLLERRETLEVGAVDLPGLCGSWALAGLILREMIFLADDPGLTLIPAAATHADDILLQLESLHRHMVGTDEHMRVQVEPDAIDDWTIKRLPVGIQSLMVTGLKPHLQKLSRNEMVAWANRLPDQKLSVRLYQEALRIQPDDDFTRIKLITRVIRFGMAPEEFGDYRILSRSRLSWALPLTYYASLIGGLEGFDLELSLLVFNSFSTSEKVLKTIESYVEDYEPKLVVL